MKDSVPEHSTYVAGSAKLVKADGTVVDVAESDLVTKTDDVVTGVVYNYGEVAVGATTDTLVFSVTVDEGYEGTVSNKAVFTESTQPDVEKPSNDIDNPVTPDEPEAKKAPSKPTFTVEKVADHAGTYVDDDTIKYTIKATNTSSVDAEDVIVSDILGDGLALKSATKGYVKFGQSASEKKATEDAKNAVKKNANTSDWTADATRSTVKFADISTTGTTAYVWGGYNDDDADYTKSALSAGHYKVSVADGYVVAFSIDNYNIDRTRPFEADSDGSYIKNYRLGTEATGTSTELEIGPCGAVYVYVYDTKENRIKDVEALTFEPVVEDTSVADKTTVYVESGSKYYHVLADCSELSSSKDVSAMTLTQAKKNGLEAHECTSKSAESVLSDSAYGVFWVTDIAAGESVTYEVTATIDDNSRSSVVNTAAIYTYSSDEPVAVDSVELKHASPAEAVFQAIPKTGRDVTALAVGGWLVYRSRRRDNGDKA